MYSISRNDCFLTFDPFKKNDEQSVTVIMIYRQTEKTSKKRKLGKKRKKYRKKEKKGKKEKKSNPKIK